MTAPFISDPDFTLYVGDVRDTLGAIPEGSIDCVVTSPPYWGLRDYGTGAWEGGTDPDCDHAVRVDAKVESSTLGGSKATTGHQHEGFKAECPRCGAHRVDRQIGLEQTYGEYVAQMVEVFRGIRRVLADHGTCWLNLGDSYVSVGSGAQGEDGEMADRSVVKARAQVQDRKAAGGAVAQRPPSVAGLKQKDLVGIPWRVALALQDDGWYLRADVIWAKPNPMPESVTDRPTKAHEYVFMLTKQPRYYFDQEAVREPFETLRPPGRAIAETDHYGGAGGNGNRGLSGHLADVHDRLAEMRRDPAQPTLDDSLPPEAPRGPDGRRVTRVEARAGSVQHRNGERWPGMRAQTVRALELAEEHGLTEAHFEAIRACGSSDAGKAQVTQTGYGRNTPEMQRLADEAKAVLGGYYREFLTPIAGRNMRSVWTIATQPYADAHFATFPEALPERCIKAGCPEQVCRTCGKPSVRIVERTTMEVRSSARLAERREQDEVNDARTATSGTMTKPPTSQTVGWTDCGHDNWRPGVVLDPFMGSGTTAHVARKLGRHAVGIELNPEYAALCGARTQQQSLLA